MKPKKKALHRKSDELKAKSFDLYRKILSRLCESNQMHVFLKPLSDALRQKNWAEVYACADILQAQKYACATEHFVAYQFAYLIKKYPFPKGTLPFDPRANAIKTFVSGENRGRRVNQKFAYLRNHPSRDRYLDDTKSARQFIRAVLTGTPFNKLYSSILTEAEFGPGANLGIHGNATHYLRKSLEGSTVTPGAIHYAFGAIIRNYHLSTRFMPSKGGYVCMDYDEAFRRFVASIKIVEHDSLDFVPKTSKTDRSIGVGPLWNGFVQKGIDTYMRKRMKGYGLDLSDQGKNQEAAREGSANWRSSESFVTLDLKNASNSVYREVVRYFLPDDWFRLLNSIRCTKTRLDGREISYELFVSMGNGYCFPLETLIFASICVSVGAGEPGVDFFVYGDDIIVKSSVADGLIARLLHYGFSINRQKTFLEGPFRESCGADYFDGEDVRPYTLDHALDSVQNVNKFLNLTRRNEMTVKFFQPVRDLILGTLDESTRLWRPREGQPESGITATDDEHLTCPFCEFNKEQQTWNWWELSTRPVMDYEAMFRCSNGDILTSVALRGGTPGSSDSMSYTPSVTFRRITRTKLTREGYDATSNWLPGTNS